MHVVFDTIAVRAGSAAIVVEHELRAWAQRGDGDRITVLRSDKTELNVPDGVEVITLRAPLGGALGGVWLRTVGVRKACRELGADALVSGVTASAFAGAPCKRWAIVYDVRHEVRPHQFSRQRRVVRRVSYAWTFRRADGLFCISARTRNDLLARRRWLADKAVVTLLGADHADAWPRPTGAGEPYVLAFGNFANKNADKVVAAWARFCETDTEHTLRLVGMSGAERAALGEQAEALGITARVQLMPWLEDAEFAPLVTGARLGVFPSDFEGFGLPAAEAMRLGLPVVVSADGALVEVTGGYGTVAANLEPSTLATAMRTALASTPEQLAAAQAHIAPFTWARCVETMRADIVTRIA